MRKITIGVALSISPCFVAAQDAGRPLAAPSEALVFKSGQSFLYREVEVQPGVETTRVRLPAAIHGTAWLGSDDVELRRAIAREATTVEKRPVTDFSGVLRRAIGREVRLGLRLGASGEIEYATGRILRTLSPPVTPSPVYPGYVAPPTADAPPPAAALVVVQVGDAIATWPVIAVVSVHDASADAREDAWEFDHELEVPVLDVEHAKLVAGAGTIGMAAMSNGLAWTPSYVLELGDGDESRLVGKAVLVNDAEALVDTRIRLVVGYPNLRFAGVRSSLLPDVTLDAFRQMLAALDSSSGVGQLGQMSQIMSNVGALSAAPRAGAAGPAGTVPGESSEDLYLYDVGRVTLAKGERCYIPLLDTKVPVRHRYDWDLPDQVDRYARFVDRSNVEPEPVWHVLMLDNRTDAPWTTGPILVQGERGPIAQSTLRYTPTSTDTKVQLTKALNLVGQAFEFRVDDAQAPREEVYMFSNRYERIDVQGRLELTNRSDEVAPVRIRKEFSGDLLSADHEPKLEGQTKGLGRVNASRAATWEFELAPGETWTAGYRYRVLIRR